MGEEGEREGYSVGREMRERGYLESVGKDDVGVHGPHVQVVDHGELQPRRSRHQAGQSGLYLAALLIKVGHLGNHTENKAGES